VTALPVDVVRSRRRTKTVQAREVDGRLEVRIPAWMSAADERGWVAEMQRRVAERSRPLDDAGLAARAGTLAQRYRLPAADSVRWSDRHRRRWGSCTPATGSVRIAARLAAVPPWVLDAVLVHELAHLEVIGHGAPFRALTARYPRTERAEGFLEGFGLSGCEDGTDGGVVGIDHVQLAMPAGRDAEAEAEAFYSGVLGIPRVRKPAPLARRGGCWFERDGLRVHLGVEDGFRPARKAHPALAVRGLPCLLERLRAVGVHVRDGDGVAGTDQAYVDDPFGNRIELIERAPR
jgi:predicted metal-dependent hydrolase/catechol 2,3-dioxygenase-like lactoylglutathione lyase family enzyme